MNTKPATETLTVPATVKNPEWYTESGRVVRARIIDPRRYGQACELTFADGRVISFSEGALPYRGATKPVHLLSGRTLRWMPSASGPLASAFDYR